jgi:pyruvate dehydrogenase E2 component (dihydrolipoamide acetyltransferase)
MEEGTIVKWHKKVGDKVEADDVLVEVATDKATVEYNALDAGYLRKILIPDGAHAIVNQPIAIFTVQAGESIEGYKPEGAEPEKVKPFEAKVTLKQEAKSTTSSTGNSMQQPAFVPEAPLEKYDFEFPAGTPKKRVAASPLAKKLAKEKGLDVGSVRGTGPSGRVTSRDLDLAQPDQAVSFARREMPTIAPGTYEEVSLTPMRKVVGTRLQQSKSFIPHFYVRQEIDAEALVQTREQLKNKGLKVTINDFIIRACALALREHPKVNSGFNSVTQSMILFKTIDIAIAVSVDAGLITPIIRHADFKNLGELSVEMKELANRAKLGKLQPEEYKGGSFTISNLGMFGISDFMAIINPPQSAILAIAGIEECVRIKTGIAVFGKKMNLTLSADHRVVDGADGAKFIKTVQAYLENPASLIV